MKKALTILIGASLLISSCSNYEAAGAYTGGQFGNILGSAIGGIAGGWRGHEIGSLVGTVGGAAIGAAVGRSADERQERRTVERAQARRRAQQQQQAAVQSENYDQSGFDPQMRGDDRIDFSQGSDSQGTYSDSRGTYSDTRSAFTGASSGEALVIRHAGIYEDEKNGVLTRGERCSVIFEIANTTSQPVYNVYPLVEEATGNRHIHISPNMRIESIGPHQAVRYTATLMADRSLRNGQIEVRVGVAQGNNVVTSQTQSFTIPTAKKPGTWR